MDDDLRVIYGRLNQLYARTLADHAVVRILLGLIAAQDSDWRGVIDNVRLMADFNLDNIAWGGTAEEKMEIVAEARRVMTEGLDRALLEREQSKGKSKQL